MYLLDPKYAYLYIYIHICVEILYIYNYAALFGRTVFRPTHSHTFWSESARPRYAKISLRKAGWDKNDDGSWFLQNE